MVINEKIKKEAIELDRCINLIATNNSLTDFQIENFLQKFEKARYNILSEIKLYNKNIEYKYEKIKTIDDNYNAEFKNNILKIHIPEVLPSFKNLKSHTHKRILLNIAEITKQFSNIFKNQVFIYIKVFDNVQGWDIDNKFIKPVADALILSNVIQDDNTTKMFYCAKGEFSENPHTEIYVFDSKNLTTFLEKYTF